jgi:hypothetical protein
MRLPERSSESITVDTGVKLAQGFPFIGFPKALIYSQTIHWLRAVSANGFQRTLLFFRNYSSPELFS